MNNIKKYNSEKATVCANKNCVTVYGDTAKLINGIALVVSLFALASVMAKAIR
ncbi:MAG: hypothetical protein AB7O73_16045 [Bacteroidia bacterium]